MKVEKGRIFGNYKVIKFDHKSSSGAEWEVECIRCGFRKVIPAKTLKKCKSKCPICDHRYEDLSDQIFGKLKVIRLATTEEILKERPNLMNTRGAKWLCICECSNYKIASAHELKQKTVQSCGCLNDQKRKENNRKHGLYQHPLYNVWRDMKQRCYNPNSEYYDRYGGRGIKVCAEWKDDFLTFYNDMIVGYEPGLTLDRIDNDGDYCKENCRWITNKDQQNNKSSNTLINYYGEDYTLSQLGEIFGGGKTSSDVANRINIGWTLDESLYLPKLEGAYKATYLKNHKLITKPVLFDEDIESKDHKIFFRIIDNE